MADMTMAEISAQITDADTKGVFDAIVLPASLTPAEFFAKSLEGASLAAAIKNQGQQPGNANYVGGYPPSSIAVIPADPANATPVRLRQTFGVIVEAPASLNEAISPNQ